MKACKDISKPVERLSPVVTNEKPIKIQVTFWGDLRRAEEHCISAEDQSNLKELLNESFGDAWKYVSILI